MHSISYQITMHKKSDFGMIFLIFKNFLNIVNYLKVRVTEKLRRREETKRERSSICWFTCQMAAQPGQKNRSQKLHLCLHMAGRGTGTWAIFQCLPSHIRGIPDQKPNSQDSNWHSDMACRSWKQWLN